MDDIIDLFRIYMDDLIKLGRLAPTHVLINMWPKRDRLQKWYIVYSIHKYDEKDQHFL